MRAEQQRGGGYHGDDDDAQSGDDDGNAEGLGNRSVARAAAAAAPEREGTQAGEMDERREGKL